MLYCRAVDGRPKEATLPERVLVVKLAEIGDALLITPALRALRRGLPGARLDVLTTAGGAAILRDSGLCDGVVVFDKHRFDRPTGVLRPANLRYAAGLGWTLRRGRYDAVVLFHHLSTRFGALKYALFCYAAGAPRRLGLDNGRGFFLTESVPDRGYGARHELDYALEVAGLLAPAPERVPPVFAIPDADRRRAAA
ncbi:MAG TPA: hypothetical protein VLA19_29490, partial [Herpetosiphonaceae bacterium]|nr:hypothetical protein [Herpetosiphonaceae bacterium]